MHIHDFVTPVLNMLPSSSMTVLMHRQLTIKIKFHLYIGQQKSTQPRPGQVELEATLSDYDHCLEDLKNKLKMCLSESESQLEKAKECENVLEGMRSWLKEGVTQLDDLQVKDPKCAVIETQQQKCQVKLVFNSTSLSKKIDAMVILFLYRYC